jgi:hypothetical protein
MPAAPDGVRRERQRYPGFDVLAQRRHWDPVTAGVVLARLSAPREFRFFTLAEQGIAIALFDRLLDQGGEDRVPVAAMVDLRLAEAQTDGWRYVDMPEDGQAWRDSLVRLDSDANDRYGSPFASCEESGQNALLQVVQDTGSGDWHGMNAGHVWSLWTRYACTAFYAHPEAWNEIGFSGPAYPRGYKNIGVDRLESFEVRDSRPDEDPAR